MLTIRPLGLNSLQLHPRSRSRSWTMFGWAGSMYGVEGEAVLRLREQASRHLNEISAKRVVLMQGPNGELMQCQVCFL